MRANDRVLITGAGGFIGGRLLQGDDRALVRSGVGTPSAVVGDLLDPPSLRSACADTDTVLHCAGYAHAFSSSDPGAHWRVNYEGTRNLLQAAVACGVQRFVFLSTVKAMADPGDECADESFPGEPNTSYGKAKRAAEDAVLETGAKSGMHVVNLRLAMVYGRGGRGNLERMVRGIRAGWFPSLPETGNRRSLLHVDDAVAAIRLVAGRPEANMRTYILADSLPYSGRQIYETVRAALQLCPSRYAVPAAVLRTAGAVGDVLGGSVRRTLPINSEVVARLLDSAWFSPARIKQELGWRAEMDLAAGIREMLGVEKDV